MATVSDVLRSLADLDQSPPRPQLKRAGSSLSMHSVASSSGSGTAQPNKMFRGLMPKVADRTTGHHEVMCTRMRDARKAPTAVHDLCLLAMIMLMLLMIMIVLSLFLNQLYSLFCRLTHPTLQHHVHDQ